MAVQNSLAARQTKTGLTAYLTQDAVKKQINSVVGGKNGTRFISSIVSAQADTASFTVISRLLSSYVACVTSLKSVQGLSSNMNKRCVNARGRRQNAKP